MCGENVDKNYPKGQNVAESTQFEFIDGISTDFGVDVETLLSSTSVKPI